jgi:hypothetical protein
MADHRHERSPPPPLAWRSGAPPEANSPPPTAVTPRRQRPRPRWRTRTCVKSLAWYLTCNGWTIPWVARSAGSHGGERGCVCWSGDRFGFSCFNRFRFQYVSGFSRSGYKFLSFRIKLSAVQDELSAVQDSTIQLSGCFSLVDLSGCFRMVVNNHAKIGDLPQRT